MTVSTARVLPDPRLEVLTGPHANELLDAALRQAGGQVLTHAVRDVDHRPAQRTTVSYTATVAWPDGTREEILAASAAQDRPSEGLIVSDGEHHVQVWRYPHDPELPGLAAATNSAAIGALLRDLGLDTADLRLNVVSYRPRKRAIIEIRTARARLFVKVLRPRLVRGVDRRHRMLTGAGVPVPRSLGWSDDGLLVLEPLRGTPLRSAIATGGPLVDRPQQLVELLDALPDDVRSLPRRKPWAVHADHYARVVADSRPELTSRLRSLGGDIASRISSTYENDEASHGDFYDGQLFTRDGIVTGILDIDTMGPGSRVDDLGCALAHLSVLTTIDAFALGARRALSSWLPVFDRRVDPRELRIRAAGVTLSLATGPFRVQEVGWKAATDRRVELAERWLDAAERPDRESPLTLLSQ